MSSPSDAAIPQNASDVALQFLVLADRYFGPQYVYDLEKRVQVARSAGEQIILSDTPTTALRTEGLPEGCTEVSEADLMRAAVQVVCKGRISHFPTGSHQRGKVARAFTAAALMCGSLGAVQHVRQLGAEAQHANMVAKKDEARNRIPQDGAALQDFRDADHCAERAKLDTVRLRESKAIMGIGTALAAGIAGYQLTRMQRFRHGDALHEAANAAGSSEKAKEFSRELAATTAGFITLGIDRFNNPVMHGDSTTLVR